MEVVKQRNAGVSGKYWAIIFISFALLLVSAIALIVTIRSCIYLAPKGFLEVSGLYIPSVNKRTIRVRQPMSGEMEDSKNRYPDGTLEELLRNVEEDVREVDALGGAN